MKKIILILFTVLVSASAYSQVDTEFWFAVPELTPKHSPDSIQFCFASFENPAQVVIAQPAITDPTDPDYFEPILLSIPANSYKIVYLKPYKLRGIVEVSPRRGIVPFGFQITSDVAISAYYAQTYKNSEVYAMKGRNALGRTFLVPMQNSYGNGLGGRSSIEIVATEDNTEVEIITKVPTLNKATAGTISVKLNRGEAYAVGAIGSSASNHLQNTIITSNKPIAVNSTDDSAATNGQDLVGDQIVPVSLAGDTYVAIKNESSVERVYIFATQPNTKVYVNGNATPIGTVNPGDVLPYNLQTKATYITSDKDIIVFQLSSLAGNELGGTMLPKITCTGSTEVVYHQAFNTTVVNILVKAEYTSYFSVNGIPNGQISSTDFALVPGTTEWAYCSKQITGLRGMMRIKNDSVPFHASLMDSGDGTFSYAYFSDYSSASLIPEANKSYYYIGETVVLSLQNSAAFKDIIWTTPDGTDIKQDKLVFQASRSTAGIYKVRAQHKEGCPIEFTFDVVVHVLEPESFDLEACKDDVLEITANGYAPYEWKWETATLPDVTQTISVSPQKDTYYTVSNGRTGENILFNGDFSFGNQELTSEYTESATVTTSGSYAIVSDASTVNPAFSKIYDHTTGNPTTGKHMVVKCTGDPDKKIWTKTVQLERNTDYEFSAWFITAEKGGQQAKLQFTIDDRQMNSFIPSNTAPADPTAGTTPDEWERLSCVWNSGSRSSVEISIKTNTGIIDGATVCIDDIYFSPLFQIVDTFHVKVDTIDQPVIEGTPMENGIAVLDAGTMGNNVPYQTYIWYASDKTPIGNKQTITVQKPGIYYVEVSNGLCKASASHEVEAPEIVELEVKAPSEIELCEGEANFTLDYQVIKGTPDTYSIFYDNKAIAAGFVTKIHEVLPSGSSLLLDIPANVRPDVYYAEIQFFDNVGSVETAKQPITITVKYDPHKVLAQKWNDVITLLNKENNGGYDFTSYQWYKNGELLTGENFSYLYLENAELDPNDSYTALLVRNDGTELFTCDFYPERRIINKPFPSLVTSTQVIFLDKTIKSGTVSFYTLNGLLYSVQRIAEAGQEVKVPNMSGLFIMSITDSEMNGQHIIVVQ